MKIHIVQKGETIWDIAKKYGVDFEEVKELNPQISSPDMIMPGMKLKIPSSTKQVKKETMVKKEAKKTDKKETYKDTSPKPIEVIKEDDKEKPKEVEVKMPQVPLGVKKETPIQTAPLEEKIQMPLQPSVQIPIIQTEAPQVKPKEVKKETMKKEPVKPKQQQVNKEQHPQMPMMPVPCFILPPPCCCMMHHSHHATLGQMKGECMPAPAQSLAQQGQMPMMQHQTQMPLPFQHAHQVNQKPCHCGARASDTQQGQPFPVAPLEQGGLPPHQHVQHHMSYNPNQWMNHQPQVPRNEYPRPPVFPNYPGFTTGEEEEKTEDA